MWTGEGGCTISSVSAVQPAGKGCCAAGEMGFGWAVKWIFCRDLTSCCTSLRVSYKSHFLEKSYGLYSVYQNSCLLLPSLFLVAPVTPWAHRCCWMLLNCPRCQPPHSRIGDGKKWALRGFSRKPDGSSLSHTGEHFLIPVGMTLGQHAWTWLFHTDARVHSLWHCW